MAKRGYESSDWIIDFASRHYSVINRVISNRMRQVGIPDDVIGIRQFPGVEEGAFTRFPDTQIGGNVNPNVVPFPQGIALDHGVFDIDHPKMRSVPTWALSRLRDRIDAAIVHEYIESLLSPPTELAGVEAVEWLHWESVRRGPDTKLPVTEQARTILLEYRLAAGLK